MNTNITLISFEVFNVFNIETEYNLEIIYEKAIYVILRELLSVLIDLERMSRRRVASTPISIFPSTWSYTKCSCVF